MLRQSLDADSVYADVALHASGLTSLQFRDEKGRITREIQSNISAPKRLRIAKRGDYVYMSLAEDGEPKVAGGWIRIPLQGPFYVGLGVCSHDKDVVEKAVFSNVELTQSTAAATGKPVLYSTLETVAIDSADRRVAYLAKDGSRLRTGRAMAAPSSSIATATSSGLLLAATSRHHRHWLRQPLQQRSRHLAGLPRSSRSATTRRAITSRWSTSFPSLAARHAVSRRNRHRTGMAGRPTARRSPSSASATANSTSTQSLPREAKRRG